MIIQPIVKEVIIVKMSYEKVLTERRMLWLIESNEPTLEGEMIDQIQGWACWVLWGWQRIYLLLSSIVFDFKCYRKWDQLSRENPSD